MLKEFNFYEKLQKHGKVKKPIPKNIANSSNFQTLVRSKIIEPVQRGKGSIEVLKREEFKAFYLKKFPNPDIQVRTETENQLKFRDTKASAVKKKRIIFLRGFCDVLVNNQAVNLKDITIKHGLFGTILNSLECEKICFVENLQPFLNAEKLLGKEYVYIHFYGRFPKKEVIKKITCKEYLHFGDYDFIGLSEFLRANKVFENSKIFIPKNFDELFEKYSRKRKEKDTLYENIKNTKLKEIIMIREKIQNSGNFLEQQILMDDT